MAQLCDMETILLLRMVEAIVIKTDLLIKFPSGFTSFVKGHESTV